MDASEGVTKDRHGRYQCGYCKWFFRRPCITSQCASSCKQYKGGRQPPVEDTTPDVAEDRLCNYCLENVQHPCLTYDRSKGCTNYKPWLDQKASSETFHPCRFCRDEVIDPCGSRAEADMCPLYSVPEPTPELAPSKYPDGNPKTAFGMKKPSMSAVPAPALAVLMAAFKDGVRKYGQTNWRDDPVSASVYYDAAHRHLLAWFDGEDKAEDSGVHHLGHVMACMAIIIDAEMQGTLNDDRPPAGSFAYLVKQLTEE